MEPRRWPAELAIPPRGPLDATVRVPGSKSITNRAAVCAALAVMWALRPNIKRLLNGTEQHAPKIDIS